MASINGLTIKNKVTWLGREGYATQGDIYLGNEKIGFWSQDGNGGEDRYELIEKYSETKLFNTIKNLYKDKVISSDGINLKYDIDLLMSDLSELQEIENEYRQNYYYRDKGIAVILNPYFRKTIKLPSNNHNVDEDLVKLYIKKEVDEFKKEHGSENINVKIFRDFKDFDVGTPIKKEDLYNYKKLKETFGWQIIIMYDKTISKEEFDKLDKSIQQELLDTEVICSNKNGCYYEKEYFLQFNKVENNKDEIELEER